MDIAGTMFALSARPLLLPGPACLFFLSCSVRTDDGKRDWQTTGRAVRHPRMAAGWLAGWGQTPKTVLPAAETGSEQHEHVNTYTYHPLVI